MHPNSIVGVSTSLILRYYSFIFKLELLGFFVVCLESSDDISTSPQCLFNYTWMKDMSSFLLADMKRFHLIFKAKIQYTSFAQICSLEDLVLVAESHSQSTDFVWSESTKNGLVFDKAQIFL